jgi:hypothetical protein
MPSGIGGSRCFARWRFAATIARLIDCRSDDCENGRFA